MLARSSLVCIVWLLAGCRSEALTTTPGDGGGMSGDLTMTSGSCSHDACSTGAALVSGCDPCVTSICAKDANCCSHSWSATCVEEVSSICGVSCGGGGFDAGSSIDAALPSSDDGNPTRQQCTPNFGSGLTAVHGRLDGYLVTILPPKTGFQCNGDSSHVHLQVMMMGGIYDIAVNVQDDNGGAVYFLAKNMVMPDGAWAEGWHAGDTLGYASLGVASADFAPLDEAPLATEIENELASVNHISVFGTGYNANGAHLIHYNGGTNDGAIVIEPQDSPSRLLLFHFASDKF
jgi:hypothetical protein